MSCNASAVHIQLPDAPSARSCQAIAARDIGAGKSLMKSLSTSHRWRKHSVDKPVWLSRLAAVYADPSCYSKNQTVSTPAADLSMPSWLALKSGRRLFERLDDLLAHFLGVAEQHHRIVAVEQLVLDAGITRGHRSLDEKNGLGALNLQDRHAIDRRRRIGLRRRVGHVVGTDDKGHVGRGKVAVDLVEFEDLVIWNVGLGEQHVHMARHAASDRMDSIAHLDPVLF